MKWKWRSDVRSLRVALKAQYNRERSNTHDQERLHNENKNQGLINTIVNHNKRIKNIENKFNFVINNFVNSNHVKEVAKKVKEIEKHVFGIHRPHSSWREFLLIAIVVGAIGFLLIRVGKKYMALKLVKYISKKMIDKTTRLTTISGNLLSNSDINNKPIQEHKLYLEQQLLHQSEKLNELIHVLNTERDKNIQPICNKPCFFFFFSFILPSSAFSAIFYKLLLISSHTRVSFSIFFLFLSFHFILIITFQLGLLAQMPF